MGISSGELEEWRGDSKIGGSAGPQWSAQSGFAIMHIHSVATSRGEQSIFLSSEKGGEKGGRPWPVENGSETGQRFKSTIFVMHQEGGRSTCQPTLLGHGGSTMWEQSKRIQHHAPTFLFAACCRSGGRAFSSLASGLFNSMQSS